MKQERRVTVTVTDQYGPIRADRVIAKDKRGGYLHAEVEPIHAWPCGEWRSGKSHRPCSCGAELLWQKWLGLKKEAR